MSKKLRDQPEYQELVGILKGQAPARQEEFLEALEDMEDSERDREQLKEAYRIDEAAGLLGVAENTVRTWLKKGIIKGRKVGKLWLIPKQEVGRILNG